MFRVAALLLLAAAGCSSSPTPQADTRSKDSPSPIAPPEEPKAEHDYTDWKRYAPAEAAFEVRFPSEPIVHAPSNATGNLHVAAVQRKVVDELAFICQWTIKDRPYANRAAESAYLMGQQIGAVNASKGRLVEAKDINLSDALGRECIIAIDDQNVSRSRTFLAGKRMISLQVMGKDVGAVRSADATKFFDSLKISK